MNNFNISQPITGKFECDSHPPTATGRYECENTANLFKQLNSYLDERERELVQQIN